MNRTEIKANAEVMLAFCNGKTIQNRRWDSLASNGWNDVNPDTLFPPNFTFAEFEYRIKPMPEEFFITVYGGAIEAVIEGGDNVGGTYRTAADARKGGLPDARVFKVTEVIA